MPKRTTNKNLKLDWWGPEIADVVRSATEPGLWAMGQTVKRSAERRAPSRTGALASSGFVATIKRTDYVRKRGDRRRRAMVRILGKVTATTALVGFGAWYSNLYEDTGAKAHGIPYVGKTARARRRKTLQIAGIGFRASARHPGVRAQPFLGPALDASKGEAAQDFADEVKRRLEAEL